MEKNLTKSEEIFCRKLQDFLEAARGFNSNEANPFYIDFVVRPKDDGCPVYFDPNGELHSFINDFPKD